MTKISARVRNQANNSTVIPANNSPAVTPDANAETTDEGTDGADSDKPAETAVVVDPFADLPLITVEDYKLRDLTTAATADPRKYRAVHDAALKAKSQMKAGWKNASAMLAVGTHQSDSIKPTSVMGMIQQKVATYGRAGVPAYVMVDFLRTNCYGNKRSHFCNGAVPPIGWAEGYIDGAISKKLIKVLEGKVAPSLSPAEEQQAEATAEKIAANG